MSIIHTVNVYNICLANIIKPIDYLHLKGRNNQDVLFYIILQSEGGSFWQIIPTLDP